MLQNDSNKLPVNLFFLENNKDFLHSNIETGAHNWNWQPNYNNYRMNNEEINNYKKSQLQNAKKVGGGILNTNVETGNWYGMQFRVPEKSDRIGPNDLAAQVVYLNHHRTQSQHLCCIYHKCKFYFQCVKLLQKHLKL